MTQAAKFFDPVLGIDIHIVMVPAPPSPTPIPIPLPHPFIGIVFDPIGVLMGAAIGLILGGGGPVLINSLPVGNTGTEVKGIPHFPMPPGISFAPWDIPGNDGVIVTGSKTVTMGGASEGRLGSMVMTCNFPINLPTSVCLAVPIGAPVIVGGPDSFDILAALTQAIRTKWVSDKLKALVNAKPGSWRSKIICFLTGHPVDVVTGAVLTDAVDFELPGPIPLTFERNYYSRNPIAGVLGQGWSHTLEAAVHEHGEGLLVQLEDGRFVPHAPLPVGQSVWEPAERYTLTHDARGYTLEFTSGRTLEFRPIPGAAWSHPLARIRDLNDNTIELTYESRRLTAATDSVGRKLRFLYNDHDRLTSVRYHRGGAHGKWVELVRYDHDANHQLAAAYDPKLRPFRYEYRGGVLTRETNRNGLSFHFEYDWDHSEGWCTRTWGDGGLYDRTITYDKLRHVTLVDDSRGGRTHYYGNDAGLVDRMLDAEGGEWRYEWHPELLRKTAEVDPLGHRQTWTYDTHGNLLATTDALDQTTRWHYNHQGLPITLVDPRGHTWRREYDDRGNLVSATDPLGATYDYRYDPRGNLLEARDPLGRSLRFEFNPAAEVVAATDREGHTTRYTHDDRGRLVRHVGPLGGETALHWDECGHLIAVERPDRSRVSLDYDPEGNLVRRVDGLGHLWKYAYGGYNKLHNQTDPLGYSIGYIYDTEENLVTLTNENNEPYSFTYDRRGLVTREVGFDGRTHIYEYDAAGRCNAITNGRKQRTKISRDPLGRLVHQIGSDGVWLRFAYDASGNLTEAVNEHCDVRFVRDACGRVLREHADDHVVESTYDLLGNRIHRRTSLGHEALYDYDANGNLIRLRVPKPIADALPPDAPDFRERDCWTIEISRDAEGNEQSRRLPGGIESLWTRDTMGRPLTHRILRHPLGFIPSWSAQAALAPTPEELFHTSYDWRSEDRLTAKHDKHRGTTKYTHDARGALIAAEDPDGTIQYRAMDAVGNIYRTPEKTDRKYGPGGRLLEAETTTYRYDDDGNMLSEVNHNLLTWKYSWDSHSSLLSAENSNNKDCIFSYDSLGRRISKSSTTQHSYKWDADFTVHITELDKCFSFTFEPTQFDILFAEESGKVSKGYIQDISGIPLLPPSTDESLQFGAWKLPGQFEDDETRLCYNRNRYYSAHLDQYISQDPSGTRGGLRQYGYVTDPLTWCDPYGLTGGCRLREANGRFRKAQTASEEFSVLGSLRGKRRGDIERRLGSRGYTAVPGFGGGTVWTKSMPDGSTAAVRLDPAKVRTPPLNYADKVPHAHKEVVPTSGVTNGNYPPSAATKLNDAGAPSTNHTDTHIPII